MNPLPYSVDWDRIVKYGKYDAVMTTGHPAASRQGYVLLHRIVMEKRIGRLLDTSEIVHHKDGDKHNNSPSNLELTNRRAHARIHQLERANPISLECPYCGNTFIRRRGKTHLVKNQNSHGRTFCSRRCSGLWYARDQRETRVAA